MVDFAAKLFGEAVEPKIGFEVERTQRSGGVFSLALDQGGCSVEKSGLGPTGREAKNVRQLPVLFFILCAALLGAGCKAGDSELTPEQEKIKTFNQSLGSYVESGEEAQAAFVELARIGSRNFTVPAASQEGPVYTEEEQKAFLEGLVDVSAKVNALVVRSHGLVKAGDDIVIRDLVNESSRAGISNSSMRPRFLLTGIVALGLGAAACYGLFKAKEEIADKWSAPEKKRVEGTIEGSAEHKVLNESLGLDEDAPKEETIKKFKGLNGIKRAQAANNISVDLAARSTEPGDIGPIDSAEKSKAVIDAATAAGTGAVKLDTALLTGVTGSVTGGKLLEWATGSEALGVTTDLLITVVTEATGVSIQPQDVFADKVDMVVTTKETQSIEVDPPAEQMTSEEAEKLLEDEDADGEKQKDAAAAIALDAADRYPQALQPTVESDGTVTIEAPEMTFLGEFDRPSSEAMVQLPSIGPSSMVVAMDGKVPMSIDDIDLSGGSLSVEFEDRDVMDYGKGIDDQTKLSVTVDNPVPGSGEDVTIYIDCPDATAFPITLDAPSPSGASLAWGSPLERCPFTVLFNADVPGKYSLAFTATDAKKASYSGSTTVTVTGGADAGEGTGKDDDGGGDDDDTGTAGDVWCDPSSGLCWQNGSKETSATDHGGSVSGALSYCDSLKLGGYSDWRLPSIQELVSLIRDCGSDSCGVSDPECLEQSCSEKCESCDAFKGNGQGYWIDGCYWPADVTGSCNGTYWSSSKVPEDPDKPWAQEYYWTIRFSTGTVMTNITAFSAYTRCVRG